VQLAACERSAQRAPLSTASGDASRGARAAARRQRAQRAPDAHEPLPPLLLSSPELRACALGGGVLALLLLLPSGPAYADAGATAAAVVAVPALGDALRAVAAKTFKGGVAGFAAGALQVCAFMWLRTAMNVQVRLRLRGACALLAAVVIILHAADASLPCACTRSTPTAAR
jgi:hypothetical protein